MHEVHLFTPHTSESAAVVLHRFPCVVGRHSACDHRIPHPSVSRRHCVFRLRDGRVWVEDLGSTNGTRLNGEPLTGLRPLTDGDRLELADLAFGVRLAKDRVEAAAPAADVLVVEDDAEAARAMDLLLRTWGHEVRVAADGPQAVLAAQARAPDAVLLDIGLPGMDGWEVAHRLRAEAGCGKTRLVAVTGDERAKEIGRSQVDRFDRMLLKPVNADDLREALARPE